MYVFFTGVIDPMRLGDLGLGSGTTQIRDEGLCCLFIRTGEQKKQTTEVKVGLSNMRLVPWSVLSSFNLKSSCEKNIQKHCKTHLFLSGS